MLWILDGRGDSQISRWEWSFLLYLLSALNEMHFLLLLEILPVYADGHQVENAGSAADHVNGNVKVAHHFGHIPHPPVDLERKKWAFDVELSMVKRTGFQAKQVYLINHPRCSTKVFFNKRPTQRRIFQVVLFFWSHGRNMLVERHVYNERYGHQIHKHPTTTLTLNPVISQLWDIPAAVLCHAKEST